MTSRAPLRIRQERQIPVPPLAIPDMAHLPDVEGITAYSAVTMFIERAQAVKPDFSVTTENAPKIAGICARLDGLPLAIELISARVKLLSPTVLLERLYGPLMLQSDGLRDLEPRHRTLNAAIDWSYQLLMPEEQTLFARLGIFVGGWTLDAAAAICMDDLPLNVLDSHASLLDKNLVKQAVNTDGEPRFMMLETIREYALLQIVLHGDQEELQKRHANYFTALAGRTDLELQTDPVRWLKILETELDNFRAALAWSESSLRLAVALHEFWARCGHLKEGASQLIITLKRNETATGQATPTDRSLRAWALNWLARFRIWQGDLDDAQQRCVESLALFRELGETAGIATALSNFGMLAQMQGHYEQAGTLLEESLILRRRIGNTAAIAWSLFFLGTLIYSQGNTERAGILWEESLIGMRSEDDKYGIAAALAHLATTAIDLGDYVRAGNALAESLTLLLELGERYQIFHTLEVYAYLAAMQKQAFRDMRPDTRRPVRIYGAAEAHRETFSIPMLPIYKDVYRRGINASQSKIEDSAFAAAWAEGRAMTLDQVVAYALEDGTAPSLEN